MKYWKTYIEKYARQVKVLVIDDGSQLFPAEKVIKEKGTDVHVEVYRITKDIPQNTFGARNLAFHIASVEKDPWVLCLDIDHVLPSHGLEGFCEAAPTLSPALYYRPERFKKLIEGATLISHHLDTYLITPDLFWKTGGYDEDLVGYYYNGSGLHFRVALDRISNGVNTDKVQILFYPSTIIADASPLQNQERKIFEGVVPKGKKPSVLNFEWERVI